MPRVYSQPRTRQRPQMNPKKKQAVQASKERGIYGEFWGAVDVMRLGKLRKRAMGDEGCGKEEEEKEKNIILKGERGRVSVPRQLAEMGRVVQSDKSEELCPSSARLLFFGLLANMALAFGFPGA